MLHRHFGVLPNTWAADIECLDTSLLAMKLALAKGKHFGTLSTIDLHWDSEQLNTGDAIWKTFTSWYGNMKYQKEQGVIRLPHELLGLNKVHQIAGHCIGLSQFSCSCDDPLQIKVIAARLW